MTLWLVRAGKHGEQEEDAYKNNIITIGWNELPDLTVIKNKSDLEQLFVKYHPEEKKMAVANMVGQIWNFINGIKQGDFVALPLKSQSMILIGKVIGNYEYKQYAKNIMHTRRVEWLKTIPRSEFDQDILFSLGAFMTVCQIKRNNAEERILKMLQNDEKVVSKHETEDNEFEELELGEIEQFAKDQIIKYIESKFTGHDLPRLIDAILKAQGYVTKVSERGVDGGVDILAGSGPLGFDTPRICVQVKSSKSPVNVNVLRELEGTARNFRAEHSILVAWGGSNKIADKENKLSFFSTRIWGQGEILNELLKYYEKFDDELKAELPLKRIWAIVEQEESG